MSLLSCSLSFIPEELNSSAKLEMFISYSGGLQILCKYPDNVKQLKMELKRGEKILCELTTTTGDKHRVSTDNKIFCQSQFSNNSVSFFLYNLDPSHTSYYTCKLSIFDPPPYHEESTQKYLHIYGKTLFFSFRHKSIYAFWQLYLLIKVNIPVLKFIYIQLMAISFGETMKEVIHY